MTRAALAIFMLQLAEGVEEGYVAAYEQAGRRTTFVYGLRFSDAVQVPAAPMTNQRNGVLAWIRTGRIVAAVHGDSSECSQAVAAYVKSLGD